MPQLQMPRPEACSSMLLHSVVRFVSSPLSRGAKAKSATDVLMTNPKGGVKPRLLLATDSVWLIQAVSPSARSSGVRVPARPRAPFPPLTHSLKGKREFGALATAAICVSLDATILITPTPSGDENCGLLVRLLITEKV